MNDAKSVYLKFDTLTDSLTDADEACSHTVFPNGRPKTEKVDSLHISAIKFIG